MKRSMPVFIREPDSESKLIEDRLHLAILRGKITTVSKLLDSGKIVQPLFMFILYCIINLFGIY